MSIFSDLRATSDAIRVQVERFVASKLGRRILSIANLFNISLNVAQDLNQLSLEYAEDVAQNINILTANRVSTIRGLAQLSGHTAIRAISARGTLNVKFSAELKSVASVLRFNSATAIRCVNNNLLYYYNMADDFLAVSADSAGAQLSLIEGQRKESFYTSTGDKLYSIYLDDRQPIENYAIAVSVNGITWKKFDSLSDMDASDNGYLLRNGYANQIDIIFGDGVNGLIPEEGASIRIAYLTTTGEFGNAEQNYEFVFESGVLNQFGEEIDINDLVTIEYFSGFLLGSNGEDAETTRLIAGYSSRSLTFPQAENIVAYLSRLSVLSRIDAYIDPQSKVFNLIALPNLSNRLNTPLDYLDLADADFKLSQAIKADIIEMLDATRRQQVGSEIQFVNVTLKRYAMFVYADAVFVDAASFRDEVYSSILQVMLDYTYLNQSIEKLSVPKSAFINALGNIQAINSVSIDILSEDNEQARITGEYIAFNEEYVGSVKYKRQTTVKTNGKNPNLGFSELRDIECADRACVPVLTGNFMKYETDLDHIALDRPIYIFANQGNGNWLEIQ